MKYIKSWVKIQALKRMVFILGSCLIPLFAVTVSGEAGEAANIEDGVYFLNVEADNNYVMNVNGGFTEEGTNIDISPNKNIDFQKFQIKSIGDGLYRITSVSNGLDLTVADGAAVKETNLQLNSWKDLDGQKWRITVAGENRYCIQSVLGTYIDNYGGFLEEGNNVWMYDYNGSATQMWMMTPAEISGDQGGDQTEERQAEQVMQFSGNPGEQVDVPEGLYCINVEADTTYVMNINGNYTDDGATIDIMPNVNADCQKFLVKKTGDGYYTITAKSSEKLLTVAGNSGSPETDLQQWQADGSDGQKWQFIYVDENRLKIRSALGTYIDNYGGQVQDANNVWMYGDSDSASQLWMLTEIITGGEPDQTEGIDQTGETEQPAEAELTFAELDENSILPDGTYAICMGENPEECLMPDGQSNENGAEMLTAGYTDSNSQKFLITHLGNSTYQILNAGSLKSLDIDGGSMMGGAKVQQWEYDGTDGQIWSLESVDENSFYIISKLGTYLSIEEGHAVMTDNQDTVFRFRISH